MTCRDALSPRVAALDVALDALGRERNRSQRILDLVRNPARHLAPCRLLLRLQQIAQVFKDNDIAQAPPLLRAGHGSHRDAHLQRRRRRWQSPSAQSWFPCGRPCGSAAGCLRPHPAALSAGKRSVSRNPVCGPGWVTPARLEHPDQGRVHPRHLARCHPARARPRECSPELSPCAVGALPAACWPPATGCDCSPARRPCC